MKPNDIRYLGNNVWNDGTEKSHILCEIAAQLAEINEAIRPRLVRFPGSEGKPFILDVSQVVGIDEMGGGKCSIYVRGMEGHWTVDGTVDEVCKKLGISPEV